MSYQAGLTVMADGSTHLEAEITASRQASKSCQQFGSSLVHGQPHKGTANLLAGQAWTDFMKAAITEPTACLNHPCTNHNLYFPFALK